MITAKTKVLSICDCGFLLLKEGIPLGTEYEVDETRLHDLIFICGGCGKTFPLLCVWVEGESSGGFLPCKLFGLENLSKNLN